MQICCISISNVVIMVVEDIEYRCLINISGNLYYIYKTSMVEACSSVVMVDGLITLM